jgi:tRNA dimethylallyltransferase
VIQEAHEAGRLPILVGGTGLYLRTLLEGIAPVPAIDPDIRGAVRALPVSEAFEALLREDPVAAGRLRPSDTSRVARALEVVRSTGRSLIDWQRNKVGGIAEDVQLMPLILLPPRDWLYARCDRRFGLMLEDDGLAECEALLARGLDPDLPVMRAIGVPEVAAFLSGRISREEAEIAGQRATRQYAKRQYTWFSRQPPPDWPRFIEALEARAVNDALSMLSANQPSIASRPVIA